MFGVKLVIVFAGISVAKDGVPLAIQPNLDFVRKRFDNLPLPPPPMGAQGLGLPAAIALPDFAPVATGLVAHIVVNPNEAKSRADGADLLVDVGAVHGVFSYALNIGAPALKASVIFMQSFRP